MFSTQFQKQRRERISWNAVSSQLDDFCQIIISWRWLSLHCLLISFFNDNSLFYLINIYLDSLQTALKNLKDTRVSINNVLIIMGDFNICDSLWNTMYLFHSSHSDILFDVTNTFDLDLSTPTNQVPTRYMDNECNSNLVIDLTFLRYESEEFNNHHIHLDWWFISDHTPLSICISIFEECFSTKKQVLIKDSEEEKNFINNFIALIHTIDTSDIHDENSLENVIQTIAWSADSFWNHYSRTINITKHSKSWWNASCSNTFERYRNMKKIKDWKAFRNTIKKTKHNFFD